MKNQKRTTNRQILSLLLALLMVLFCFPVTALGTDELEEPVSETLESPADAELTAFERGVGELGTAELESMTLNAADVPEIVTAQAIAEKDHVLRLREQEEDLNTVIFQNRDGGKTVYLYADPVKYVDDDGNVKDRSTALTAGNVIMGAKVYAYSATDNSFGQYYPTQPQNGVLLAFGEYFVEMTPVITGILTLRDTTLADNKVTYNKVFGNGTSLVYTPTLSGVKEDIILQAYTGKSSFSFTVKTNGLAIIQDENDTFLADFEGNKVASLGKVIITDKVGKTVCGSMTVTTKAEFEEYTVTINAPVEFLTNPTTVYPVTVDPTFYINETYESGLDDFGNAQYSTAIEDLCVYDGTEDPVYDHIASIGAYQTGYKSAMLYRITPSAWNLLGVNYYLDSSRFESATLHVPVFGLTTGLTVAATPSLGSWTNGTSQNVESMYFEDYYPDSNSDTTALSSSANSAGAEIDVTKVFEYLATHPSAVSRGFMMYVFTGTELSNPQNYFSVYQIEESSEDVYFEVDYSTLEGEYMIKGLNQDLYLEAPIGGTNITCDTYSNVSIQKWYLEYCGNDSYTIRSAYDNTLYMKKSSSNVILAAPNNSEIGSSFKWYITYSEQYGGYVIKSVYGNTNLTRNTSGDLRFSSSLSSSASIWTLTRRTGALNDGIYFINNLDNSNENGAEHCLCVDIYGVVCDTDKTSYDIDPADKTIGGQLWAFNNVEGSYYSIISLGATTESRTNNMALSLDSDNGVIVEPYEGRSDQLWRIIQGNGCVYLSNKSQSSGVRLYMSNELSNVSSTTYTELSINKENSSKPIPDCTWSGRYGDDIYEEQLNIKIEIESGLDTEVTDWIDPMVSLWNGLSDNVRIYTSNEEAPLDAYTVTFKVSSTLDDNTYGQAKGLNLSSGTETEEYENNWSGCTIYLNDNLKTQSTDIIKLTIAHEMGHALKLAHPGHSGIGAEDSHDQIISIMNQNPSGNLYCTYEPSWFDIYRLRQKWG